MTDGGNTSGTDAQSASACADDSGGACCTLLLKFFQIHNTVMRLGDRLTADLGLTSARWLLLGALSRLQEPATVSQTAEAAMMSVQNASRMLALMESEGIVTRSSRAGSGRTVFVRLTDTGRELLDATGERGELFHAAFLDEFTDEEIAALSGTLGRLLTNLEAIERRLASRPDAPADALRGTKDADH